MAKQATLEGFNARGSRVGLTGAVRTAPIGTKIATFEEGYDTDVHTNLGYISPDGVEISFDEEKQTYTPWQEAAPIREDITQATTSVQLTLWETGPGQLARFLGVPEDDMEDLAGGGKAFWQESLPQFDREQVSVDMVDGDALQRVTFLNTQISERGSLVLKKDEIYGLQLTYTTFPAGAEYSESEPDAIGKTARWQWNDDWTRKASADSSSTDGVQPVRVVTDSVDTLTVDTEASIALEAVGGTGAYAWSISDGELPDGLKLAAGGTISGTPTTDGTSTVTVRVADAKGLFATRELEIAVDPS